jgi:hypothetical protein
MNDPNEFNLPEFDVETLVIAKDLGIPEAFEVAVEVETRENSVFIPLDEIDLTQEE